MLIYFAPFILNGKQSVDLEPKELKFEEETEEVKEIFNLRNLGVGGATKIGIDFLEKQNCDIIVKLDADGQLNPELIPALIKPLVDDEFEAAEGNRISSLAHL